MRALCNREALLTAYAPDAVRSFWPGASSRSFRTSSIVADADDGLGAHGNGSGGWDPLIEY